MENHEQQGDSLVDAAIQADDEQSSQKLWQDAADEYHEALSSVQNDASITGVRLRRKLAFCHRKLGNNKVAITLYLKPTKTLIRHCTSTDDLRLEEAYIQLEYAYHELNKHTKSCWGKTRELAEGIIEDYSHNKALIESKKEILYVLGEAYNLLGIALSGDKSMASELEESTEGYWRIAEEKLKEVKSPRARHAVLNIRLNRALTKLDRGHCDKAIQILEEILYAPDPADKLSIQQRLGIQYNLAAAYIDRLADNDLAQARALAHQNLSIARENNHFDELVKTVELYGNIIKEEIKASIKSGEFEQVQPLVTEYENYFHEITESDVFHKNWHTESDGLVIHRLLAEIYLHNKATEKAKAELQHVEAMEFSNTQQDREELFLTRAVFEQSRNDYPKALFNLECAKDLFRKAERFGMVIEVNIRCAELNVAQDKFIEAKQDLLDALTLANNLKLACRNRITRLETMLKDVDELASKPRVFRLFYSYAHEDEKLLDQLEKCLKLLKRQRLIETWHDRRIAPGEEWKQKIDENFKKADIILLLISSDFIDSDYAYDVEMKDALDRHKFGTARVIPVIIRDTDWQTSPFAHLQALPKNGKAVTTWSNRDTAWKNVAEGIKAVITDLRAKPN